MVEFDVPGLDRQVATLRHCIARIHDEVHQDLLELTVVGANRTELRLEFRHKLYAVLDKATKHLLHPRHELVDVEDRGAKNLVAAEREELARERRRARRRTDHLHQVVVGRFAGTQVIHHQVAIAHDHGEHVVEVMRDAARELAHRLHFLRLPKLRLEQLPVAHVRADAKKSQRRAVCIAHHAGASGEPARAAVGPEPAVVHVDIAPDVDGCGHRITDDLPVVGMHPLQEARHVNRRLLRRQAEHTGHSVGPGQVPRANVEFPNAHTGTTKRVVRSLFTSQQRSGLLLQPPRALREIGGTLLHLLLQRFAVPAIVVAERLEPQEIFHTHGQLGAIHRLAEKVLRAGAESAHPRVAVAMGRDHDDRNVSRGEISFDLTRHVVAVHPGHHEIEQDQVGRLVSHHRDRLLAAGRDNHLQALGREHRFQQRPVLPLVVDDEDAGTMIGECGTRIHDGPSLIAISRRKSL